MKKFIAMLLALAMVLSLAACGSKTDAPAETKAQTAAEKPAATEKTEAPAPAAEPVTLTWGSWVFAEDSVRPIYQEDGRSVQRDERVQHHHQHRVLLLLR